MRIFNIILPINLQFNWPVQGLMKSIITSFTFDKFVFIFIFPGGGQLVITYWYGNEGNRFWNYKSFQIHAIQCLETKDWLLPSGKIYSYTSIKKIAVFTFCMAWGTNRDFTTFTLSAFDPQCHFWCTNGCMNHPQILHVHWLSTRNEYSNRDEIHHNEQRQNADDSNPLSGIFSLQIV